MISIQAIQRVYGECLDRAIAWLNRNGYRVNTNVVVVARKTDTGDVIVETTDTLHFQEWPYRAGSRDKIDILASLVETISLEEGACRKATLHVNYFQIRGATALATESLHYDFGLPPQKKHPICHVQNSNNLVDKLPESFNRTPDASAIRNRCQNVRIPSAFINLPALFVILAADHMSETHWHEFMTECVKYFRKLPPVAKHRMIDEAIATGRLCAWAWYEM